METPADIRRKFGQRVRSLRKRSQITQTRLAELADISLDFVGRIERGVSFPSVETLASIARVFKVEVKDLFDFTPTVGKVTRRDLQRKLGNLASKYPADDLDFLLRKSDEMLRRFKG